MTLKRMKTNTLIILFLFVGIIGNSNAQDSVFQATVDRNHIPLGTSAKLTLDFQGNVDPGALELPRIDGFQVQYLGPSTKVTIINGNYSKTTSYTYNLFPLKVGTFQFPSLKIEIEGETYVSETIPIEVVDSQIQGGISASSQNEQELNQQVSLEDKIFLSMEIDKKQTYLHERIPVTIKLYIQGLSVSDVSYPEFEKLGFSSDEFAKPKQYELTRKGLRYEAVEFNTFIYPSRIGKLTIGPASLQCNVLSRSEQKRGSRFGGFNSFFDDFFDTVEKHPIALKSSEVSLDVLPFPETGKPANFSGAVGKYAFELDASPLDVKVGDPITIRMLLTGTGNLNAVTFPKFKENEKFKVYEPQMKEIDGVKVLEQVLIPKDETINQIPSVHFNYFDTSLGEYQNIVKEPIPIKVSPADNQGALRIFAPQQTGKPVLLEKIGQDIVYIKEKPGKFQGIDYAFYKSTSVKVWIIFITAFFIFGLFYYLRNLRVSSDIAYARRLKAPKQARDALKEAQNLIKQEKSKEFYLAISKILQDYFGNKFHLSSQGLTVKELEKVLTKKEVKEQTLIWLKELFDLCDQACFASVKVNANAMKKSLEGVEKVIDYFERKVS